MIWTMIYGIHEIIMMALDKTWESKPACLQKACARRQVVAFLL
jgi:hypothetical protein